MYPSIYELHLIITRELFYEVGKLVCQLLWVSCRLIHFKALNHHCRVKLLFVIIHEVQKACLDFLW